MSFKHESTRQAVEALCDLYAEAQRLHDELNAARQRYRPDVFKEIEETKQKDFNRTLSQAMEVVKTAKAAAYERADSMKGDHLTMGDAEEDFKLLSLPVTLSPDELRALAKRHEGNVLFSHAVGEYAEAKGYNDARDLLTLQSVRSEYKELQEKADVLSSWLDKYSPKFTNIHSVANEAGNGTILQRFEKDGLFADK